MGSQAASLPAWLCLRFVAGAMSLGYNNVLSVYKTELTSGSWRSKAGHYFGETFWYCFDTVSIENYGRFFLCTPRNLGLIVLGGLAYFVRNMRTLELIVGLSASPFLLGWILMPESPRSAGFFLLTFSKVL